MRAVTWQGKRDVRVENVPDPTIQEPTDAVIRITSTGLCGSDLHLYEVLTPFMTPGDILGHEPMGIVEEVGAGVPDLQAGDRVVVPFQIACGNCWMCLTGLPTQCETTQVTGEGMGAALFGYTRLYGAVPGAQAEYLRVPQAQFGPIKVPEGPPDDRFVYLSDVLPTAWQAVRYAEVPKGGSVAVLGLGPIGDMACRVAQSVAPSGCSASTWCPSGCAGHASAESRPSTSGASTTRRSWSQPSATRPTAAAPTPSSTRSAPRPTAAPPPGWPSRPPRCCPAR